MSQLTNERWHTPLYIIKSHEKTFFCIACATCGNPVDWFSGEGNLRWKPEYDENAHFLKESAGIRQGLMFGPGHDMMSRSILIPRSRTICGTVHDQRLPPCAAGTIGTSLLHWEKA